MNTQTQTAMTLVTALIAGLTLTIRAQDRTETRKGQRMEQHPSDKSIEFHEVETEYQNGKQEIQVILPDKYRKDGSYRVLYVLPPGAGSAGKRLSEELGILKKMDAANRYDLIVVEMSFEKPAWFGDHASNPKVRQASYMKNFVVPYIEDNYAALRSPEGRLLIGFSKSGWGAFSLILKYPEYFGYAASWDAPMTATNLIFSMRENYETSEQLDLYCPALLIPKQSKFFQQKSRLVLTGSAGFEKETEQAHKLLEKEGIKHHYDNTLKVGHDWGMGWMEPALSALIALTEQDDTKKHEASPAGDRLKAQPVDWNGGVLTKDDLTPAQLDLNANPWHYAKPELSAPGGDVRIRNQPVANLTTNSAVLRGWLVNAGLSAATVGVLWGPTDGGTNWARSTWAHTKWWSAGAWTNNTYPAMNITGLERNTRYYYAFAVSNAEGVVVAPNTAFFTTFGRHGAWWKNPVVKYKEDTGRNAYSAGPSHWSKDESDQYLFCPVGFSPKNGAVLYSLPALVGATHGSQVAPIVSASSMDFYGNDWDYAWNGGAVSDDLGRVLVGNFKQNHNSSLSCSSPWIRDVNAFEITNDIPTSCISGLGFSHDSAKLYSVKANGDNIGGSNVYTWVVGDLGRNGNGLTSNTMFTTSMTYIDNLSVYYIDGKDLVYYGEANPGGKVCVYDPGAGAETVLISSGLPNGPICNVKVGGVAVGQMHLYVQVDSGALYIYVLAADGKSVGPCLKSFTADEIKSLLNIRPNPDKYHMRVFEVTDDETHAFFSRHTDDSENVQLYVVCSAIDIQNRPRP